jgi:DNA phosphorothioation-dependent restriction protein DptH
MLHEQVAAAILGPKPCVSVDQRGRLVIIDDNVRSAVRDRDDDGFEETITIGSFDGGQIVAGDPLAFYEGVRAKVGDWGLFPPGEGAVLRASHVLAPIAAIENKAAPPEAVNTEREALRAIEEPSLRPTGDELNEANGVILAIGKTVDSFRPSDLTVNISDTHLNQLNMGVVGDLGTGKTQLLKSLILQISDSAAGNRGIKPRFLIFDYKRDYSTPDFVEATGARVVRPFRLPLNLFDTTAIGEAQQNWPSA